jgi:GT2 family glycosyltransferase
VRSEATPHSQTGHYSAPSSRSERPRVTLVLVTTHQRHSLDSPLYAILSRCVQTKAELIVVHPGATKRSNVLSSCFPGVRFVGGGANAGLAALRQVGLRHAGGDIVYFLEECETVDARSFEDTLDRASRYAG